MGDDEGITWISPVWLYPCLLLGCFLCWAIRQKISSRSSAPFLGFQRRFSSAFFLALAANDLQNAYVEPLYKSYGLRREQLAELLFIGHAAALTVGTFLGISADFRGRRKLCCVYAVFLTLGSVFKQSGNFYALCISHALNGLASSLLYSTFESWMISEHEKLGFRQEWLSDIFCMMSFGGAIVSVGSTAAANFSISLLGSSLKTPSLFAALAALASGFIISNSWTENGGDAQGKHSKSSLQNSFPDKRLVTLGFIQASFDISVSTFWLLWIPTIVADGREVHAGSIYAALMASAMLGSCLAWLLVLVLSSPEKFLPPVFLIASFCLMVPAYDYQEIGVLVASFCVFHLCVGFSAPLLARSRSLYVSSARRAGVYALFNAPTRLALMIFLIQGSRFQVLDNNFILYSGCVSNLVAAVALHFLNTWKPTTAEKFST